MEFHTVTPLRKGQEVFVSYGDTYFDEDFEGHRKSELLQIAANEKGDSKHQNTVELQRALIRLFSAEEFVKELKRRSMVPIDTAEDEKRRLIDIRSLIVKTEMP